MVLSVAFSSDGRHIVSGSVDNSVRVWDSLTGEVQNVLEGHTNSIWSVAFSPDGKYILSGSADNSVRVWDLSMGEVQKVLKGHANSVLSVTSSADGKCTISGSDDNSVEFFDISLKRLAPPYIREKLAVGFSNECEYTGWLLSPNGDGYLMFVPLDEQLPDAANILTIPPSLTASVNFTGSTLGPHWMDCYSP